MKYRYQCEKCSYTMIINRPMGEDGPALLEKDHSEMGHMDCSHRMLHKIIERPNLNGVNRFPNRTRSSLDRRHKK